MKKLTGMTAYIKEKEENKWFSKRYINIAAHATFLTSVPTLGMFVACDLEGNILEEPEFHEPNNENEIGDYDELRHQYQQAKSRVIFKGFDADGYSVENGRTDVFYKVANGWLLYPAIKTIEDLVPYNLEMV